MDGKVVSVALDGLTLPADREYDYVVPARFQDSLCAGMRVVVPFGKGNKKHQAMVLRLRESSTYDKLKPVLDVLDDEPCLDEQLLDIANYIKQRYFCTFYEAVRTLLPAALTVHSDTYYYLPGEAAQNTAAEQIKDADAVLAELAADDPLAARLYALIREQGKPVGLSYFKKQIAAGPGEISAVLRRLVREGKLLYTFESVKKGKAAKVRMARLAVDENEAMAYAAEQAARYPRHEQVITLLLAHGTLPVKEICSAAGTTAAVLQTLARRGVIELFDQQVFRRPEVIAGERAAFLRLSPAQEQTAKEIFALYDGEKSRRALLFGVTGSGKTQVYLDLIERMRLQGKGVIVLVPEIALTPQLMRKFTACFGAQVALFHSALSSGERYDEFRRVRSGKANIVIGTRSAVFAPVKNLGMIILDEEQAATYKSEITPRYHARHIAAYRCAENKALLLLGSATPSVESFYQAQKGHYRLFTLRERYGGMPLPGVDIVDMRAELEAGNRTPISRHLYEQISRRMEKGEQSILFLNRRGYHTFLSCRECGYVLLCPNCSVAMTYHKGSRQMKCHYCGHSAPVLTECPECGSKYIRYFGSGTQKIEEEIAAAFPSARIARMDADTTAAKGAHGALIRSFEAGEYDILLGTQMVTKGLDFERVTLVGVLAADQSLYMDDVRASERTFSLLTQVIGRSGRGQTPGKAVIQTYHPDHPVIVLAAKQAYEEFYREEIAFRRLMLYPPFCDLCQVVISGPGEQEVIDAAYAFYDALRQRVQQRGDIPMVAFAPCEAKILKLNQKYRYKMIIKCRQSSAFHQMMNQMLCAFLKERKYKKLQISVDINPEMIL